MGLMLAARRQDEPGLEETELRLKPSLQPWLQLMVARGTRCNLAASQPASHGDHGQESRDSQEEEGSGAKRWSSRQGKSTGRSFRTAGCPLLPARISTSHGHTGKLGS